MDMLMPGDNATIYFVLQKPMPLESGLSFTVSENGKDTIMSGVVSQVMPLLNLSSMEEAARVQIVNNEAVLAKKTTK